MEVSHHTRLQTQNCFACFLSKCVDCCYSRKKNTTNLNSALLLLCRKIALSAQMCWKHKRMHVQIFAENHRRLTCGVHFFLLFERFRIRIDFNIRKFGVTSQDKRQCKQINVPSKRICTTVLVLFRHCLWAQKERMFIKS